MIIMRIVLVLYVICLISFILGMLSLLEYEMQIDVKGASEDDVELKELLSTTKVCFIMGYTIFSVATIICIFVKPT